MRPAPFCPEPFADDPRYVRDTTTGLVWHRVEHRVLYADTDRSGVVYHANYFRYFELGRATLLRDAAFPYRAVEDSGYVYPIFELGLKLLKALQYDDPMWVHTRFRELGRVRVGFDYVITAFDTGALVCEGFTRHCATNSKGSPVAVDPMTIQVHERFPK
jgi:acyl-CoA thioester hydrolase